jgi:transposase InsO family protein
VKFTFIAEHAAEYPVKTMCRVLEVSRAGYYEWKGRAGVARQSQGELKLRVHVRAVFRKSRGTYGSPRVHRDLRDEGVRVSRKRVERVMREEGLCARPRRRFRGATTDSAHAHRIAENLLDREFSVEARAEVDQVWVGDITYLPTRAGWLYLAVVLDLKSRRVVGHALGTTVETDLPLRALQQAIWRRRPGPGLIHHSDRGVQYASHAYREVLGRHGIQASMSRKGNCWDNAVAESFFATLEWELVGRSDWRTHQEAERAVNEYIERWYNAERRHSSLEYLSPAAYEARLALTRRAA